MEVMHVFTEKKPKEMSEHMEHWFGVVPMEMEDLDTGAYLACYCGGWIIPMQRHQSGEISIGAIWHKRRYKPSDHSE